MIFDVHNNGFWPSSWGDRPGDRDLAGRHARRRLAQAPRLVPLFSHRYVADGSEHVPSPVFSVCQADVIYYGDNLLDYVAHEFNVPPLHPGERRHVPFWSDLAEGLEAVDLSNCGSGHRFAARSGGAASEYDRLCRYGW